MFIHSLPGLLALFYIIELARRESEKKEREREREKMLYGKNLLGHAPSLMTCV